MLAPRFALVLLAGLALAAAFSPVAEADHRCYTIGSPQVCRYVPGDQYVECVLDERDDVVPCVLS